VIDAKDKLPKRKTPEHKSSSLRSLKASRVNLDLKDETLNIMSKEKTIEDEITAADLTGT